MNNKQQQLHMNAFKPNGNENENAIFIVNWSMWVGVYVSEIKMIFTLIALHFSFVFYFVHLRITSPGKHSIFCCILFVFFFPLKNQKKNLILFISLPRRMTIFCCPYNITMNLQIREYYVYASISIF